MRSYFLHYSIVCLTYIVLTHTGWALQAQQTLPPIIKFDGLEHLMQTGGDTTVVLNFWATWCKPCVAELPVFDTIANENENKRVRIVLVSLDFAREYKSRLLPFVEKSKPRPPIVLLDEPDYNKWINTVDTSWSGAIPTTVVFNNARQTHILFEGELTTNNLRQIIYKASTPKE